MSTAISFAQSFASYLLRHNLQHLLVHVTNHCNFRCEHCFIDFSPKKDLKLPELQKLAKEVGPLFWLDIAGGEPFLRKDLPEVVASFQTKVVQIPTNGSLTDLIVESLKRMKTLTNASIAISLSLDGLPETHAKIRGNTENWEQVWKTFDAVRSLGDISIKINSVLSSSNASEFIPLMKLVRERCPDFHSVILLRGEPMDPTVGLPSLEELRRLEPEIFSILKTYDYGQNAISARILRNYHRFLWDVSLKTIEEQRQVIPCYAGKFHMVVWGDGRVSSCEMLPSIGNIRESSWKDIMKSDAYHQQVASIERKECHCTHNCAMLGSILFNPINLVQLTKNP